jgi:type I pantothenate kinase
LSDIKAGKRQVSAPVYSHLTYDVISGEQVIIDRPDILIVEGLNVLIPNMTGGEIPFVSDFFDFSIYLDADDASLEDWYIGRFQKLRETAFRNEKSYFKKYAELSQDEATQTARDIWRRINLPNLKDNIAPTRARASLVLTKGSDHRIQQVSLRKL